MRLVDRCIDSDRSTVDSFCHSGTVRPKYTYCMYALNMNLNIIDSLISFVWLRERDVFRQMGSPTRARNVQTYRLANHLNKCGLG